MKRIGSIYRSFRFSFLRRFPRLYFASLLREEQRTPKISEHRLLKPSLSDGEFENLDKLIRYNIADGEIRKVTRRQERMAWLKPVIDRIEDLLVNGTKPLVHEVGCGSTINLRLLKKLFGDRIELSGSDIAPVVGSEFEISLRSFDDAPTKQFDLVFSVTALCLAQDERRAFLNAVESARHFAVLVEPIWETALPHQRAFLTRAGHKYSFDRLAAELAIPFDVQPVALPFSIKHPAAAVVIKRLPRVDRNNPGC
jgi:SAM-dependent methyltransferase